MLIKYESKSARVKGLVFHPKRKWLLASLHNGVVQLYDYSEKTLIYKFDEHKGPVRAVDFHKHQPLFVTGGDDAKIKVWNYKSRRCLFTLDGHDDYIRTTFFHNEHPWIISSSDDQSIRIWNWQSRSKIANLTGHTHYVMCAQFHMNQELILSASIDQTLRVWDISGLKLKHTSSSKPMKENANSNLPEILKQTEFSCIEAKEAHNSEINWCCFHPDPTKQMCLSTADDNSIKIWRLDSRKGLGELEVFRGHYNNVSCAVFHPKKELVLSASEDRSIKVWDLEKRSAISTTRREADRYWSIAAHPSENLFAAGHDTGFILFKLERERPAFVVLKNEIFYIRKSQLLSFDLKTQNKTVVLTLKPKTEMTHYYHKLHAYSSDANQFLVSVRTTNVEKSIVDLYHGSTHFRNPGLNGIFIGNNRYAILKPDGSIVLKLNNQERKLKMDMKAEEIYEAGTGRLLIKSKSQVFLWDVERGCAMNSVKVDDVKFIVSSDNKNYIACICSYKIVICDGQLNILGTIVEQRKIKSAAWDEGGVLVYSTPVHVKYALTDGETTTILSVQQTLYIMAVRGNQVYCIDRSCEVKTIPVDGKEFRFKQAVMKNERTAIVAALRQLGNLTRAEISFLVKKGYPGLGLSYVNDHHARFSLALQAFNINEALNAAIHVNQKKCWEELAQAALQVGHVKAVERAYQELKKPYKLALLYLVCDQRNKMIEARELARELGDTSTEFIISLLMKDFVECTQIIRRRGYATLAYTCAINHGLYDLALEISQELTEIQLSRLPPLNQAKTSSSQLESTIPDIGNSSFDNWPLLDDPQDNFEVVLANQIDDDLELDDDGEWEDDELKESSDHNNEEELDNELDEGDGWGDGPEDLLDDDDDDADLVETVQTTNAPAIHESINSKWTRISDLPLHHILAGSYETARGLLASQAAIVEFGPFNDVFEDLVLQSRASFQGLALFPTMFIYPTSNEFQIEKIPIPSGGYVIEDLEKRLEDCYLLFGGGKFSDAIDKFRNLLLSTLFLQIYISDTESLVEEREDRAKEIISICREYILGLQIWIERKNITSKGFEDHKRGCELAAYFAKLKLDKHRRRVLDQAFKVFVEHKEEGFYKTRAASSIAKRLLDYISPDDPKKAKLVSLAEKVKASYDSQVDQKIKLDYDDLNPYSLCAATFRPIFSGFQLVSCPLCKATYKPDYTNHVCKICLVAEIGKPCTGIRFVN